MISAAFIIITITQFSIFPFFIATVVDDDGDSGVAPAWRT